MSKMLFKSISPLIQVFHLILFTGIFANANRLIDSCSTDDNYTDGSIFQSNLQQLLSSLQINAINSGGFSNITIGEPVSSGRVSGVLMCYGDKTPAECEACINTTTANMTQACPYSKRASVFDDRCYLRYSNENFLGILTSDQDYYDYWKANASNPFSFNRTLYKLMDKLSKDASTKPLLYSTDYSPVSDSNETVYALVQCRRDLSANDCNQSIADALEYTQKFVSIRQSVVVYLTTCYLRYSVYPFDVTIPAIMRAQSPPPSLPPSSGSHQKIIIIAVASTCLVFVLVLGFTIWLWRRKRTDHNLIDENYSEENGILSQEFIPRKELHVFDLRTLRAATNNFSKENMLGEGGFGPVYKGTLPNGEEIAVKRLKESSKQGGKEFEAEVRSLAALKHKNLVQLAGYYRDGNEQFLCYEYLSNGSLGNLLCGTKNDNNQPLNWEKRYKIAQGISCGLRYVHEESIYKMVHRDLKPENVLIDKDLNPKISDFGTAKFFIDELITHKFTMNPIWTRGYVAPEYHQCGKFSFKSDVYSFGIILLEIVTGQKSSFPNPNAPSLIENVIQKWVDGTIEELKDPNMGEAPINEIKRCIQIGLCCVHDNATRRPTMGEVDLMLQGYMEVPPVSSEWMMSWMEIFSTSIETDSDQTQQYIVQGQS